MRKDVILGMSIGGVLLAIVITYLALSPNKPKGVDYGQKDGLVGDVGNPESPDGQGQQQADATKPAAAPAEASHDAAHAAGAPAAPAPGKPGAAGAVAAKPRSDDADWARRLSGKIDTRMLAAAVVTHTPDALQPGALTVVDQSSRPAAAPAASAGAIHTVAASGAAAVAPDAAANMHTHVVQKGETLSSIAAVAYGSANYYPHILRANPNLNPNRMRPGITINLPDINAVHPPESGASPASTSAAPGSAAAERAVSVASTAIDATHEYSVKPGDSLHKIAIKLYGKISMVDKIYDLNKELIGPDKAKLKVHMILKLPEPPVVVAASHS